MATNGIHKEELWLNPRVEDADQFYPKNEPVQPGEAFPATQYPQNTTLPILFQPLKIRSVDFKNRIWVAPMCMYSSDNGHATDFHLVHLGSMALRGTGAIIVEATAVLPEGRISPEDAGLWTDSQIEPLRRIVNFCHAQGTKIGIQLAHAGRKASAYAPWVQRKRDVFAKDKNTAATVAENGWPDEVVGPSDIKYDDSYAQPKPLTKTEIDEVVEAFGAATERCKKIGFDFIEIHGAHGYLIHSFVTPLANNRTDEYGGSLENRMRMPLAVAKRIREVWGKDKPIFYRISASDWAEGPEKDPATGKWLQWGIEQSTVLCDQLQKTAGIDLIDVSSGGVWKYAQIYVGWGYQVQFAQHIKKALGPELLVGAVGMITDAKQAEGYLQEGKADVILAAREFLRHIDFPIAAAEELGVAVKPATQFESGWLKMLGTGKRW
ncbi:putative NADH:flavin oxidoreductase 1 [Calocera cornea HHB12733]|uniref:Putative NADH:flavin oxidoreductase 1 n=1 Tax=Calocera cornea HHB12733 TaxID=1353952 RepID=A0A165J8Q6_9BASI|nr:putative NADH:flavin oxidoreductase 1 [Calocera cornea HHB12733]